MLLITTDGTGAEPPGHAVPPRGAWLRPEGATVRVRDGRTLVTDGPYAGTGEHVAGFEIVECADLDVAIETAAAHPSTAHFAIEIRPFPEA